MNKLLAGLAFAVLAVTPILGHAQTMPSTNQGADVSGQASKNASDAVNKATEQAVEQARKDKQAEDKAQAEAKKALDPAKK